jgi:predicted acetyltransferase
VTTQLRLSTGSDAHILQKLYPLYQHEISEFDADLSRHGLFGVDDDVAALARHAEQLTPWWKHPESLFPYLIIADGEPAGFSLITGRPHITAGIEADFVVYGFFVLHAYRGSEVAEQAAIQGFERHRGRWEVVTYPAYARGIAFWRRVVGGYTAGRHVEAEGDHPWGRRVAFTFDNGRRAPPAAPTPASSR